MQIIFTTVIIAVLFVVYRFQLLELEKTTSYLITTVETTVLSLFSLSGSFFNFFIFAAISFGFYLINKFIIGQMNA